MRLIWLLVLVIAGLWVVMLYLPEYMTLVAGQWQVQVHSVAVFAGLFVATGVVAMLSGIFYFMYYAPRLWRLWRKARHQEKRARSLEEGVQLLIQGDWRKARRTLDAGARLSDRPGVYYLGAAQASHYLGEKEESARLLEKVLQSDTKMTVASALTRARLLESETSRSGAISALQGVLPDLKSNEGKNYLLQLLSADGRWREVLQIIDKSSMDNDRKEAMRRRAWTALLRQTADAGIANGAEQIWAQIPRRLRRDDAILAEYVNASLRLGVIARCEPLLRKRLKKKNMPLPHNLVMLYACMPDSYVDRSLAFIESLLQRQPTNAALLRAAGVLCLRSSDRDQRGRSYLEASLQIEPQQQIYQTMAILHEHNGDTEKALQHYRSAMNMGADTNNVIDKEIQLLLARGANKEQ